jgi:hypothetical protein
LPPDHQTSDAPQERKWLVRRVPPEQLGGFVYCRSTIAETDAGVAALSGIAAMQSKTVQRTIFS